MTAHNATRRPRLPVLAIAIVLMLAAVSAAQAESDLDTALAVQRAFIAAADRIKPSTVFITAEYIKTGVDTDIQKFFKNFPFAVPLPKSTGKQVAIAAGSGVIVTPDGYILTNDHVVSGSSRVRVKLRDGREFPGTVKEDPTSDLALIKINATGLPAATLGDSDAVQVGQWAIAVGNPFELTDTVTVGVVSALTREALISDSDSDSGAEYYPDLIQTDASVNPGNSGGPLADIQGQVIGINTVMESPSGGNVGIGFAIPSNTAKLVMSQLIATGRITRGYLGIEPADVTAASAITLGVEHGALIKSVTKGSPADKAGLRPMDVIVEMNGQPVASALDLRRATMRLKPGTRVPLGIVRDTKRQTLDVTIGEVSTQAAVTSPSQSIGLGLTVQGMTGAAAKEAGAGPGTRGVVVTDVVKGGSASLADPSLQKGDVILQVNGRPVTSVEQFNAMMNQLKPGQTALILFQRKGEDRVAEMSR